MPTVLVKVLNDLYENTPNKKYVFYGNTDKQKPIRKGGINEIFARIANELGDDYYKEMHPTSIRKALARYMYKQGIAFDEIMYIMDINIQKLGIYFTDKDIKDKMELITPKDDVHPLELVLRNVGYSLYE